MAGCWRGCLSGARCRQLYDTLYDLNAIFLFQIISFKKYFYVSLCNIFYCFCGGPWATAQSPPHIRPCLLYRKRRQRDGGIVQHATFVNTICVSQHKRIIGYFVAWREVVRENCQARKMNKEDAIDRCKWRKMVKND